MELRKKTIPFDDKFKRVEKKDRETGTFILLFIVKFSLLSLK